MRGQYEVTFLRKARQEVPTGVCNIITGVTISIIITSIVILSGITTDTKP